ncbi:MAG TPA: amidohydrolase family protein, partial [Thermoanaerobaculia bacterium]|nr:amidohydrolase family protein [Thermoanaerobaculia bacterium]
MLRRCLSLLLLLAAPVLLHAETQSVFALTGATVHPVSGGAIANGTVVVRDGLIEAVGAGVAIPPDATVIEVKGAHVYPGLIDAQTTLGAPSAPARRRGPSGGGQSTPAQQEQPPELTAASLASRSLRISDDDLDARRATGVATILTAPNYGIFNGQSVVLNLGAGNLESRVIRNPATMQIAFNPRPTWTYPDSMMGVVTYIRQTLMDAQQQSAARSIYERAPAGQKRPEESEALAALGPVLRRELLTVFFADTDLAMRRAQAIAREFNLRYAIAGGRQAYRMADELKNVPLLVSVKWPTAPAAKEDREEQPLRVILDRKLSPTTPAVLAKAGALFALVSGPGRTADFLPGIRTAIENGLAAADALRAVTLSPARILGIDRQIGSIERGKIANLIVTDKPLFEKQSKVTRMFIDGREIRLPSEEASTRAAAAPASPIDGGWNLTVRTPQGDAAIRVTLHLEDGKV